MKRTNAKPRDSALGSRFLPCIFALTLLLAGCGPGMPSQDFSSRQVKPPKPPPDYPPAKDEPLDPALRAAAEHEIEQAADSSDPVVRAHALEVMRTVANTPGAQSTAAGATGGSAWRAHILRGLSDTEPLVRFAASMAAGELKLPEAHDPLLKLVDDPDPNVQVAARFALHRLGDFTFTHGLEKSALDPRPGVRANTAMVLGLLGEKSALKILKVMQRDGSVPVRIQVAEAIWRLGSEEGLQSLVEYSLSKYPDDQMVAVLGLAGPRDRRVIEHIRSQLSTSYPEVALVAARAMGMLGPANDQKFGDEGYGVATAGAKSADPRQKMLAALAFGAIGRPDSQSTLVTLLKDPDGDVRLAAAQAILQLRPA